MNPENVEYLATKQTKLGHWLGLALGAAGEATEQHWVRPQVQGLA